MKVVIKALSTVTQKSNCAFSQFNGGWCFQVHDAEHKWIMSAESTVETLQFEETEEVWLVPQAQYLFFRIPYHSVDKIILIGTMDVAFDFDNTLAEISFLEARMKGRLYLDFGYGMVTRNFSIAQYEAEAVVRMIGYLRVLAFRCITAPLNFLVSKLGSKHTIFHPTVEPRLAIDTLFAIGEQQGRTETQIVAQVRNMYPDYMRSSFSETVETTRQRRVRTAIKVPPATNPLKRTRPDVEEACIVGACDDSVPDALFIPCGHTVACLECTEGLRKTPRSDFKCPLCRTPIEEVISRHPKTARGT